MTKSRYKVGDSVLFINGYGVTYKEDKMYRWGQVVCGFITRIEYIKEQDACIYTVGTISPTSSKKPMYRILSDKYIFDLEQEDQAMLLLYELCEEPDED